MTKQELSDFKIGSRVRDCYGRETVVVEITSKGVKTELSDSLYGWVDRTSLTILDPPKFKVGDRVEQTDSSYRLYRATGTISSFDGHLTPRFCQVIMDGDGTEQTFKIKRLRLISEASPLIADDKPRGKARVIKVYDEVSDKQYYKHEWVEWPEQENSTMKLTKFQKSIDTSNEAEVAVAEILFDEHGHLNTGSPIFGQWLFDKFRSDKRLVELCLAAVAERDKDDE